MLPLPVFGLVAFLVAAHHAERFTDESWFWRSGLWYGRHPTHTGEFDSFDLTLFLKHDGTIRATSMDGSWDALERYLTNPDGQVWSVNAFRYDSFRCVIVPSLRRSEFTVKIESSEGGSDHPLPDAISRITAYLESPASGDEGIALRRWLRTDRIRTGQYVRYDVMWGYALLNATMLALLLLVPLSIRAWFRVPAWLRYRRNRGRGLCVSCSYSLAAIAANTVPPRCPECGTLNPPRSSAPSPPAPSSSPAPSAQSAPPPPTPPATAQSPPR